jgi:hypothetical protein
MLVVLQGYTAVAWYCGALDKMADSMPKTTRFSTTTLSLDK